jgi:hypothetical protein
MRAALVAALILATATAAGAQTTRAASTAASDERLAIRGFGDAGLEMFTASKSFKAVLGKNNAPLFGGGLEFVLPDRVFLSLQASRMRRTGHRVFVFNDQVFTLNEEADIKMTPLEFTGGYRFGRSGLIPYVGGGIGWLKYQETSPHAVAGDEADITHVSYHALGGAEVPMASWLAAAVEGQWTAVPNAFGTEPTSVGAVYDEHDLGGLTVRVKVIIGR